MTERRNFPESWYQMNISSAFASMRAKAVYFAGCTAILALSAAFAPAQTPEARIVTPVDNTARATLTGSRPPRAQVATDAGRMPGDTPLQGATIYFSRSAAQESAIEALIAAQQNPASPQYHQWLTPDQFAAQFGAADADLAKVQTWLQSQGFTGIEVSRNRSVISFSGTTAQIEAAFGTEMHYYKSGSETHFAPSSDLSIPAAFGAAVLTVGNVTDMLRPKSQAQKVKPEFTSSQTGGHFVQPGDVAVIYDINAAYNAGYTGQGQSIAIVGQSAVVVSDITNFQNAAGMTVRNPTLILMPNTGASTINPFGYYSGDESESDLDLEYSGAIAKGATIYFVYTGNSGNYDVFDAMGYAVTNRIAPIVSVSYGDCETDLGSTYYAQYNAYLQQAATQGQTVIAAAGDAGSTACYGYTDLTTAQQAALTVGFPADSQYVTGMGGTEYLAADVAVGNTTYWSAQSTSDVVTSAKSYIPEMVWNDDLAGSSGGLSAGTGGVSVFTPRPSWQTGVTGITTGSYRLVPDISLASSPNNAGYLYCSSDVSSLVTGSCTDGFRASNLTSLTVAGGTSFAAPIFAGMLAIINQKTGSSGQGVANSTLYTLAANATTYASAFHDITTGNNGCASGVAYADGETSQGAVTYGPACPAASAGMYAATGGYDEATGLGSIDLFNLMTAWPNSVPLTGSTTTISPTTSTPGAGSNDPITFKVASASSSVTATPTGTLSLSIDNSFVKTLTLSSGTATYQYSSTVTGAHLITAVYSGDTNFSTSTSTVTITVGACVTGCKPSSTTVAVQTTPAVSGTVDPLTITVIGTTPSTPAPTGTVQVSVNSGAVSNVTLVPGTTSSTATYNFSSNTLGSNTVSVSYLGDTNYQTSAFGPLTLMVKSPGTFTLSAPTVSVAAGATATETVTLTPTGGYFGLTNLTLSPSTIVNACYSLSNPTVSGIAAVPVSVTIYTSEGNCGSQNLLRMGPGSHAMAPAQPKPGRQLPVGLAMAGLLAIGFAGRRSRKLRGLIVLALLAVAGFGMSGCGSSSTAGQGISTNAPTGSYTVTVTASDNATGTITATTTFTLTVQ